MSRWTDRLLSIVAASLKQTLPSYCDLDTADGDTLISSTGDRVAFLKLDGMTGMLTSDQISNSAVSLREGIASSLKHPGHALQANFTYDPDRSGPVVARQVMQTRSVAKALGLNFEELFAEREAVWTKRMSWEESTIVLWTRRPAITREASRQERREQRAAMKGLPETGHAQALWHRGGMLEDAHTSFVQSTLRALRHVGVSVRQLPAAEAVRSVREAVYPETSGTGWTPHLPGSSALPRISNDLKKRDIEGLLWEPICDQVFTDDALVLGARQVQIGNRVWSGVDMRRGPETPASFGELLRTLRQTRTPFRISLLIEGAGESLMRGKLIAASFLAAVSETNRRIHASLRGLRSLDLDSAVKLRVSLATWAPAGDVALLRRREATLTAALQSWGVCQAAVLAGDPLEAVLSSSPGIALASTAPEHAAPLTDVLRMMPWNRPGSPWREGSLLFCTPEEVPHVYDPSGSLRQTMFSLIFGEPGHGKSVLSNTLILGLLLSSASLNASGARMPLVGVIDVGESAKGMILLIQASLPEGRQHEATYIRYENHERFSINPFDTQLGCREPLPLESAAQQNLISLACMPIGSHTPFEGMDGLIAVTIAEAYRLCSDVGNNTQPKTYNPLFVPDIDRALRQHRIELTAGSTWWDVVDALCDVHEYRLASLAQRYAVPVLADLIEAVRAHHIQHQYGAVEPGTGEGLIETFQRYITGLIEWLPNLSRPTVFDTGEARVIVLDLEEVALSGSQKDDRQTEIMYLMGYSLLGRSMFLRPGYVQYVPPRMREYHRRRFTEVYETTKRLALDEMHRVNGAPRVLELLERARREGRKHNVQITVSSQMLRDFPASMVNQATEVFILGAGNEETNIEAAQRFRLSEAGSQVVRHRLKGPGEDGSGAPFLARLTLNSNVVVEQLLLNVLGSREIWALSTKPQDVALRARMYAAVGHVEAWRRLATVFPNGTAVVEIGRRISELVRRGVDGKNAESRVVDELAQELVDGRGLGLILLAKAA